jgi:hypothetical protein
VPVSGPGPHGPGDPGPETELARRRLLAVSLRRGGATYQQIADAIPEYEGRKGHAYKDIQIAFKQARAELVEGTEQLIQMEDVRDDHLRQLLYRIIAAPHYVVQNGRIVLGQDGEPLLDDGPVMSAIDRLGAISARFHKRHGLDQPERIEIKFEERTELEVRRVVEAILAGFAAADLPADKRMQALEAAQLSLGVVDGEVVSDTEDPG